LTGRDCRSGSATFARFLDLGHEAGVPVIPAYDTGADAAELMAEAAATYGVERMLIGTSRQGAIYHIIKGLQQRLEGLLPPDTPVQVVGPETKGQPPGQTPRSFSSEIGEQERQS
jgi:hypothetical protein